VPRRLTRFESLLQAVPDALVGMDQEGVIRFVNRQAESLFGYDRDEMVGQLIETLVPDPLWQIYAQHREKYFADSRTRSSGLDVELSGRHHNGREFPIHVSMSSIDTGDVLLVIAGVGDVATQQRAVKNAGLLEAIVEYSDEAIMSLTIDGTVTSWNPAAERMYGYSPEEVIGRSDRLIPQERAGEMAAILARIRDGHVEHAETMLVRKDGTAVPVSITAAPIRDEGGTVVGVSAVHRDMTEQEHAAQYARGLIEASLDPLMTISADGKINDVNEATVKVTGVGRDRLIGTDFSLYFTEPDKANEGYQQVFLQGSVTDYPLTARHQDGTLTDLLCNASVYRDRSGNVLGILATGHVVTKQMLRQREIAQEEAEKLERLAEP
jgi:PAS domain S-box-containing protein